MLHPVRRFAALACAMMLFFAPALAQSALIEGEISLEADAVQQLFPQAAALEGEVTAVQNESGVHAQWESGMSLSVQMLPDGSVRFATGEMRNAGRAYVLPGLPAENPIDRVQAWLDQLDGEKTYANAVYSSLFTRALSVDLTGQMLSPILGEVVAEYPYLLSFLGLDSADVTRLASSAQTDAVWGNITRYKGDEQQYPDLSLLVISLQLPSLPNMYLWLRTDEFGSTLKFAMEEKAVTDWDETLLVLEAGESDTGFMISGFTLNFTDDEELNIYIEATLTTAAHALTVECDYYEDYTGDYLWAVEMLVREETLGDVMEIEIEAEEGDGEVSVPDLSALTAEPF